MEADEGATRPDGSPYTPMDLREIWDWVIKPQLRNVAGVTEINSIPASFAKEYPWWRRYREKLAAHGFTLADIVAALERNNANVGADCIRAPGRQYLIPRAGQVGGVTIFCEVISRGRRKASRFACAIWADVGLGNA